MLVVTFKSDEDEYSTYVYETAEELNQAIYCEHSMDAVVGLWEVEE